jgi:hypothetical protein
MLFVKGAYSMVLHLTKTLAEKLNVKPAEAPATDDFLSWRAHYIQAHRQRFVVFMNDASRFTVVLNKANAAALKKLPELFIKNLREALLARYINPDVIDAYITELGEIRYTKNSDRKRTAQLNKNIETVWWAFSREYSNDADLVSGANNCPYNVSGKEEVIFPDKKILEILCSRYGIPVIKFSAVDIHVKLFLGVEKTSAVRYLRIPLNITFKQLHKVIQAAFEWQNYHIYSFGMFKEWPHDYGTRPDIELKDLTDPFEIRPYEREIANVLLTDYFPNYKKILYRYDYGDNWEHYIEFSNITEDYDEELPKLLLGEGDAPPEDVGSIAGFADFQEIISDPTHEDYQGWAAWAEEQQWHPFDFEVSARRVKYSLKQF